MVSEGEGKIYSGCVVFIHLMFEYLICVVACILTLKSLQSSEGDMSPKKSNVSYRAYLYIKAVIAFFNDSCWERKIFNWLRIKKVLWEDNNLNIRGFLSAFT